MLPLLNISSTEHIIKSALPFAQAELALQAQSEDKASNVIRSIVTLPDISDLDPSPLLGIAEVNGVELPHLDRDQETLLRAALLRRQAVFDPSSFEGCPSVVVHITPQDKGVIFQKQYPLPKAHTDFLKTYIPKLEAAGIISESSAMHNSPILIVRKPNTTPQDSPEKSFRVCADLRRVNKAVVKVIPASLPRIDDILSSLSGNKWWSLIDLRSGFWHLRMDKESSELLTISPPGFTKRYKFDRLPFGYQAAPFHLQATMSRILAKYLTTTARVYMDDVLIMSQTFEDHVKHVEDILSALEKERLRINVKKCKFAQRELVYLGFLINEKGAKPDPAKVAPLKQIKSLKNVKEIRSFLGLVNFFSNNLPSLWQVAHPLQKLLKKDVPFEWGPEQQEALIYIIEALTQEPIMCHFPNFDLKFELYCDSALNGTGAILKQEHDGVSVVISYYSKSYPPNVKKYSAMELELWGILLACRHFAFYLKDSRLPFDLFTDHKNLKWLYTMKSPSPRLARWQVELSSYNMTVKHISGLKMGPDFLSRVFPPSIIAALKPLSQIQSDMLGKERPYIWDKPAIREAQISDPYIQQCREEAICNTPENPTETKFKLDDQGLLYKQSIPNDQLVIPKVMRHQILELAHTGMSGHYARQNTQERLKTFAWWPGNTRDVVKYTRSCDVCLRYNRGRPRPAPLVPINPPPVSFQTCACDTLGPFPQCALGYKYLISYQCMFSRFVFLLPARTVTSEEIAETLVTNVFCTVGMPGALLSDNAPQLIAGVLQEVCKRLQIKRIRISSYRPESNSRLERSHADLIRIIANLTSEDQLDWSRYAAFSQLCHNLSFCRSTGETPHYVVFLRDAHIGVNLFKPARVDYSVGENYAATMMARMRALTAKIQITLNSSTEKRVEYFDRKAKINTLKPGDKCFLKIEATKTGLSPKLAPRWCGPFRVLERVGKVNIKLRLINPVKPKDAEIILTHVNKCKFAPERLQADGSIAPAELQDWLGSEAGEVVPRCPSPPPVPAPPALAGAPSQAGPAAPAVSRGHDRALRSKGPVKPLPWVLD